MTTHNTHKNRHSCLTAGFEPAIPASQRPQIHALDSEASELIIAFQTTLPQHFVELWITKDLLCRRGLLEDAPALLWSEWRTRRHSWGVSRSHGQAPNFGPPICAAELQIIYNPYPSAFPYGNGMVLHFCQQQESSTTKTVHRVINKGFKAYV